ncbi:hypothetical protein JSO19_03945 [Leucobacter sp. UCMA 4100]|uniref:hypothetical protein n=1 Tax=Leucobacter sp. UCMA 4100 TaxID=2810534 RepID=UPI0022EA1090|nr:hypothetical protein [Leucobacter sp. UCMA 4100]MDA3146528.1 hypothetical protein [Leucobacter sp. UCMA 4100]
MLETVETWPVARQREAFALLPQADFRDSSEFVALLEQLHLNHAEGLVKRARRWGYSFEPDEAVNMLVVNLLEELDPDRYVADYVAEADNPFAYLGRCAFRSWLPKEFGVRGNQLEIPELLPDSEAYEITEFDSGLTDIGEVVELCLEVLLPRTPKKLHGQLGDLVAFLAVNPPQRLSYEHFERQAAAKYCPSFNEAQVSAVMNITWGGRPNRAETSLMGQFLLDEEFKPEDSPSHYRALRYYQKIIAARTDGSRFLGKGI